MESSQRVQLMGQKMVSDKSVLFEHNVLCDDGRWVNRFFACSGSYPHCEKHCERCTLGAFKCKSEKRCLKSGLICDGVKDCTDGSDEQDCKNVTKDCNDPFRRCNGFYDCPDGRDEQNCQNCSSSASTEMLMLKMQRLGRTPGHLDYNKGYHCKNDSRCISYYQRCDGVQDCPSGEDEQDCTCYECLMHPQRMYICQRGQRCFLWDNVCDGSETKCPDPTTLDKEYCSNRTISSIE